MIVNNEIDEADSDDKEDDLYSKMKFIYADLNERMAKLEAKMPSVVAFRATGVQNCGAGNLHVDMKQGSFIYDLSD